MGMLTFLALSQVVDATEHVGGAVGILTVLALSHVVDATQHVGCAGEVHVPCTHERHWEKRRVQCPP